MRVLPAFCVVPLSLTAVSGWGTFLFLGFAFGTLPLVFIHYSTEEIEWGSDLAVFSVVSAISFVLLRKFFRNRHDSKTVGQDINEY